MSDIDLHGCVREPFPGFDEEITYLERSTVKDREEAIDVLVEEFGMRREAHGGLRPIHMRYSKGEEARRRSGNEHDAAWLECKADHPDAVPFWKDDPTSPPQDTGEER